MINVKLNSNKLIADLNNIAEYSFGFLEGVKKGKNLFFNNIGGFTKELIENYIDANARTNPAMLHHVYEWHRTGSPDARLFDITYTVGSAGLSFYSNFRQSTSIKNGSRVPFYNKAKIIEQGIPVTIKPVRAQVLAFEDNGEQVFTRNPIDVNNPGGEQARFGFQKTFDIFFSKYFTQAFLKSSGIKDYLENPIVYKKNLPKGRRSGRAAGVSTGYAWIAKAGYKL